MISKENLIKKKQIFELKDSKLDKLREEEGEDLVREAILSEKDPKILVHEEVEGIPLKSLDFQKGKHVNPTIAELNIINKNIEKDFTKKSVIEVGKEQTEDLGREDIEVLKKKLYGQTTKKQSNATPTIYELMKKKQEKEKKAIFGQEVAIENSGESK